MATWGDDLKGSSAKRNVVWLQK